MQALLPKLDVFECRLESDYGIIEKYMFKYE